VARAKVMSLTGAVRAVVRPGDLYLLRLDAAVAEVVAQLLAQPRETLQWTKMVLKPPVPAVPATR
jgi:hypothetical protein